MPRGSWYRGAAGLGGGRVGRLVHAQSPGAHPGGPFPSFADTRQSALCPRGAHCGVTGWSGSCLPTAPAPLPAAAAGEALVRGPHHCHGSDVRRDRVTRGRQEQVWVRGKLRLSQVWWMLQVRPCCSFPTSLLGCSKGTSNLLHRSLGLLTGSAVHRAPTAPAPASGVLWHIWHMSRSHLFYT